MADTNFTNGVTLTDEDWFNDINDFYYTTFAEAANAAAAFTAIKQAASDTATGVLELAIQSEMETATDVARAVTPGRQHFHPGHPKFFVRATANSTTIQESYNVTSVADTATGRMTVTIATDFGAATWCPLLTIESNAADTNVLVPSIDDGVAAGTFVMEAWAIGDTTEVLLDPTSWCACGFGDQA